MNKFSTNALLCLITVVVGFGCGTKSQEITPSASLSFRGAVAGDGSGTGNKQGPGGKGDGSGSGSGSGNKYGPGGKN